MKCTEYPSMGERCYSSRLKNGLEVRVVPKPGFARCYAFYAVNFGAIDTAFTLDGVHIRVPDGIAHYLEHKMFDMPYGDAMNRFAEYGANPNAFTGYTMTAYYFEATERFEENLRTLLEMVSTPYFTQASVDKEQGIIGQEIQMCVDSPDSRVYENLFRAMYRSHPVRVPIEGTVQSIAEITPAKLELCHRAFYTPANAMLCVVGDVDAERVVSLAEEVLPGDEVLPAVSDYGPAEEPKPEKAFVSERMEVSMPSFQAGFKAAVPKRGRETMKAEFVGDLAADLLLGQSSPLYCEMYESGLVDGSFSAGYEGMKGVAMFSAGGDSKDPEAVAQAILRGTEKLCREGADPVFFERLKKSALGHKLRELDSFENTCFRLCSCWFDGTDYFDFADVLRSVTADDLLGFLSECVRPERMSVSVIEPKNREE